jgi:replicative DNA helicase
MERDAAAQRRQFFRALYPARSQGLLDLRALPDGIQEFVDPRDSEGIENFVYRCAKKELVFGLATRRHRGDGSLANCADLWALAVDIDFKALPEHEARERLDAFPLPPSIVVMSGGGFHVYWLLKRVILVREHKDRLYDVLRRLAAHLGADRSAAEPAHCFRVPGTFNHKYTPPRLVTIERHEPRHSHDLSELEHALPPVAMQAAPSSRFTAPEQICEGNRNATLYRLGRSLKGRGLSDAAILAALGEENRIKCVPPLTDDEVERIATHVVTQPDRPGFAPVDSGNSGNSEEGGRPGWEPPVPFHAFMLPPFPTAALPDWLRVYVEATAIETQTPPDLAALVTLSVVAATCAKVVEVHVRPGWVEPVNLFTVVAMDPGNRKSAVFSAATAPLDAAEQMENQVRMPEILVAQSRLEAAKQRLHDAQAALKKAAADEQSICRREVQLAAEDLAEATVPALCRRLADDITPEKLTSLLAEQDGRLALMSAEGDIFDTMAGRYTAGSVNVGVFLKGHSGDGIRVDRIGRPPEYIERPTLTICLTVQPEVIRGLHRRPEFRGRGLLARFFYALPESLMGRREIRPRSMPVEVRSQYDHAIEKLAALAVARDSAGRVRAHELTLSRDAQSALEAFERWLEPQLGPQGELAYMTDWAGKLAGGVIRVAGLLHMATHWRSAAPAAWDRPIAEDTVTHAIRIGHYLIVHALAAYTLMGADPEVERAQIVLGWVTAQERTHFTVREVYQGTKGRFKKVAELTPALRILLEHGFIREAAPPFHPGPGRKPSPTYEVNPLAYSQNPHNPQNALPWERRRRTSRDVRPPGLLDAESAGGGHET